MGKPVILTIDSINKEDVKAAFFDICENAINCSIGGAKKKYLGFAGNEDTAGRKEVNIHHLLLLCEKVGVTFKVEMSYTRNTLNQAERAAESAKTAPDFNEGMNLCDSYNKLKKQEEEITNPALLDIVKESVPAKVISEDIEEIKPYQNTRSVPKFNL